MRALVTLVALGLGVVLPMSAPGGSIEDVIDREMPASGAPGLAYAVVVDGEMTSAGARGVVRLGGEKAVTPDTPFLTGSISKSFTALSVMQLVEAGEIQLDAEVSQYLDVFSAGPPATSPSVSSSATPAATPPGKETRPTPTAPAGRTSWRAASTSWQRSLPPTHPTRSGSTRTRTTRSSVAWSRS